MKTVILNTFLYNIFSPHSAWNVTMAIQMTTKDKRELANTMQETHSKKAPSRSEGYVTSFINTKVTTVIKVTTCPWSTMPLCNRLTRNTTGSMPLFVACK